MFSFYFFWCSEIYTEYIVLSVFTIRSHGTPDLKGPSTVYQNLLLYLPKTYFAEHKSRKRDCWHDPHDPPHPWIRPWFQMKSGNVVDILRIDFWYNLNTVILIQRNWCIRNLLNIILSFCTNKWRCFQEKYLRHTFIRFHLL